MIVSRFDYDPEMYKYNEEHGCTQGVGMQLLDTGQYDAQELSALMSFLELRREHFGDGVVMLDCGANIGAITIPCAKMMYGWGAVVAIEPQEFIFYALCGNIVLNNCFNVMARQVAVSDVEAQINIQLPDYSVPQSFGTLSMVKPSPDGSAVSTKMIDSFKIERLDLLKLDIEGMEINALRGAAKTIKKCQPIIWVEHIRVDVMELLKCLDGFGYTGIPMGQNTLAVPRNAPYVMVDAKPEGIVLQ